MRKIVTAVVFGAAIWLFAGPAGAIVFICTYCDESGNVSASAPPTPPTPNIGTATFGDSTTSGPIINFNVGNTYEDIFNATLSTWDLNFGVQPPDKFFVQIYNTNFSTGYTSGFISPAGGYLTFFPNGTYDVFVTLEGSVDPPGAMQVTFNGPLVDPPTPTPLPAALPLFAGGLSVMGWIAGRKKRKVARAAAA
jgi:hypothetical protein